MNAELEERILYVLSALEDANEALDKCDRLMMTKRSEGGLTSEQDKEADSKQVVLRAETQEKKEQEIVREKSGKKQSRAQGDLKQKQPVLSRDVMQKTKAVQTECSFSKANALLNQPHKNMQDGQTLAIVRRGRKKELFTSDPDFGKILKKIQTNNDQQWKNVRKFIRKVLMNELEQEKWSRKSTEDLNVRLAKQNQQLRSKLQEKREEREKQDDRIRSMKTKFKEKSRVLNQNQQTVVSRCQDTFDKLSKLHNELEGIQQQLVVETERSEKDSVEYPMDDSITHNLDVLRVQFHQGLPTEINKAIQSWSKEQQPSTREEILKEYYPVIVESRVVMENLLSSIGRRISRLIEINTRASINESLPLRSNFKGVRENFIKERLDFGDTLPNDDLLFLFSKEFDAAANFWKARSFGTYKRLQNIQKRTF